MTKVILTFLLVAVFAVYATVANPTPVPSDAYCQNVIPEHSPFTASKTDAPYTYTVTKKEITNGESVQVTLAAINEDAAFKEFLIVARNEANDAIGQFQVPSDDTVQHKLDCGDGVSVSI